MEVWLNGEFVPRDEARLSVFDAGVQHAVGLFETMLARNGTLFRPLHHMERLKESAAALHLSTRLRPDPLAEAAQRTVGRNLLDRARVRVTVTGGDLNLLQAKGTTAAQDPTILIVAQPPTAYPEFFFTQGVTVTIADPRANPLDPEASHKTISYWSRIRALQIAASVGAGEALWFSVTNHIASGCVSNVFLVKDGRLRTPFVRGEESDGALPAPVLPGITRAAVIECAERDGVAVERAMLTIEDVLAADEVFLTNSSWGVLPVVGVEKETIGAGAVGSVTTQMREAWDALVEKETSSGWEGGDETA